MESQVGGLRPLSYYVRAGEGNGLQVAVVNPHSVHQDRGTSQTFSSSLSRKYRSTLVAWDLFLSLD